MKYFVLLIFLLYSLNLSAQNEGWEITYKSEIIVTQDSKELQEFIEQRKGLEIKLLITDDNYKYSYIQDGIEIETQIYLRDSAKLYRNNPGKEYIAIADVRMPDILNPKSDNEIQLNNREKIMGYDCFLLTYSDQHGTVENYYAEDVKINYANYEGHEFEGLYQRLKDVNGALPLKMKTIYFNYFETKEAVKVEKRVIKDGEFDLPNKPLAVIIFHVDVPPDFDGSFEKQFECYKEKSKAASIGGDQKIVVQVMFMIDKEGEIQFANIKNENDNKKFHEVALHIVNNCGFKFKPGMVNGKKVNTEYFFPVEFNH